MKPPKRQRLQFEAMVESNGGHTEEAVGGPDKSFVPQVLDHHVSDQFRGPGASITDHQFRVPLDYAKPSGEAITVFVREVQASDKDTSKYPYLLYFQGGPGSACTRPVGLSAWLSHACSHYRVLLMDQRGTGRSTPITCENLSRRGSPQQQADYAAHFRADNIVRDAEAIRLKLVDGLMSVLGQSFGGFCIFTYLSLYTDGLNEAFITGGIPPAIADPMPARRLYERTFQATRRQNSIFYKRFPTDVAIVRGIVQHLLQREKSGQPVLLPDGSALTARLFQTLGCQGLGFYGGLERLHYLMEGAWDGDELSRAFLTQVEQWVGFSGNPLYALLHESIYCQGEASNWAAETVKQSDQWREYFDAEKAIESGRPVPFTGEHIFPFHFTDLKQLQPMKEVADILAAKEDWPPLYSTRMLERCSVPTAAAVYTQDVYVDYMLGKETLAHAPHIRVFETNEYMHSGLRDDSTRILDRLMNLARDTIPHY